MAKIKYILSQDEVRQAFDYDPDSGLLKWKISPGTGVKAGQIAGSVHYRGYIQINYKRMNLLAHRVIWVYMTGKNPTEFIDHIDGNASNNKWINLREATNKQNQENRAQQANNSSGYRGVTYRKKEKRWQAQVQHNKKYVYLGCYATKEQANEVVVNWRSNSFTHDFGRDRGAA